MTGRSGSELIDKRDLGYFYDLGYRITLTGIWPYDGKTVRRNSFFSLKAIRFREGKKVN